MADSVIIKLSRPVNSIDREITEITLREPTGRDLMRSGMPMKIGDEGAEIVAQPMHKLIGIIGGITSDAVDNMVVSDWTMCAYSILGFFTPRARESTSDPSISTLPDGGATPSNSSSA